MTKDTKKIIQALTYLAGKEDGKVMDDMKAYKLLWLADRYHLRTITGDAYYAMPYGIVPSDAKCVLENAKTKMRNPKGYKERYIATKVTTNSWHLLMPTFKCSPTLIRRHLTRCGRLLEVWTPWSFPIFRINFQSGPFIATY